VRLGRPKVATVENKGEFKIGIGQVLVEGNDISIISCGVMVNEALIAVNNLRLKGVKARLINLHTVQPIDKDIILKAAIETKAIVVCEEHAVVGGLASAVDEVVAENHPVKVVRMGVKNRFGQSGEPADLLREYNLTASDIEKTVLACIN
jgi:transketolase